MAQFSSIEELSSFIEKESGSKVKTVQDLIDGITSIATDCGVEDCDAESMNDNLPSADDDNVEDFLSAQVSHIPEGFERDCEYVLGEGNIAVQALDSN